jgi:hypothetical protein
MGWSGRAPARQRWKLARGANDEEHAMSQRLNNTVTVIGIDIGKASFHIVGLDSRGAIVLRQKWSRSQVQARLANMPRSAWRPALVLQKGTLSGRKGSNGASSQKSSGLFEGNSNLRPAPPYDTARPFNVISFNYKTKLFGNFKIIFQL